jgi:O-antigen/teichoic acid export membrane protein
MRATGHSSSAWRVRCNVSWNLFGILAYASGQWLQLVILAHMGGPAAVGTYAFALAFTAPVMVFATLCLRSVQASDVRDAYTFHEYQSLRGATTVAAVFVIVIIAWATGAARGAWAVLLPVCAMRAADALSDIYYGLWQQRERMSVIAWGLALNSAGSVALMTAASIFGGGVPGAAVGAALGSCAALLFIRLRTASDRELRCAIASGSEPVAWRRVFCLLRETAPLGVTVLLSSLQQNVPRFFVQSYAGPAALGVFAAASQLTATADLVGGALAAAATPRLGAHRASRDVWSFRALARNLVLAGVLLGALGVALSALAGRWFLEHVYRPEFASGAHTLVILSAAAGMTLVASLLGHSLTSARVIAIQPLLLTVTLTVLVVCCSAVVPRWGGDGAAWALFAATSVHALGSCLALRRAMWKPSESLSLNDTLHSAASAARS